MSIFRISIACAFTLMLPGEVVYGQDTFDDTFFESASPLKDFPQQLYIIKSKPEDVSDLQYNRLITQIELRLRRSGFRIKSGTPDESKEYTTNVMKKALSSKDPKAIIESESYRELFINLTVMQLRTTEYIYSTDVSIITSAWVPTKNGPVALFAHPKDGGNETPLGKARLQNVQLYSTTGTIGINIDWAKVTDATLHEVDQFINDWLAANPR